jgi:hypothetical protein
VVGSLVYFMGLALAITVSSTSPDGSALWGLVCLHPACCVYFWGEVLSTFERGNEGLNATTMAVSITNDVRAHPSHLAISLSYITPPIWA